MRDRPPLILFYDTLFWHRPSVDAGRGVEPCRFTTDRAELPNADAVVFDVPNGGEIWAVPKYPGQLWVAAAMESAALVPDLADPEFMRAFDLTMTHRRDSDVWSPYFGVAKLARLFEPIPAKTEAAPAVLFCSAPHDASGRFAYLAELMRDLRVDSYGRALQNRRLDGPDLGARTKHETIGRYKFCLCFENAIEPDYVTEKFFSALIAGTVPVYRGAPNIGDFAPGENCFIDAADFAGPAALGAYLDRLDRDDVAYRRYFDWRQGGVSERFRQLFAPTERPTLLRLCDEVRRRADPRRRSETPTRPLAWRQWIRRGADGRHGPTIGIRPPNFPGDAADT